MTYVTQSLELDLFPEAEKIEQDYSATFAANMSLPIHKWYRYTAGFSAVWVNNLIREQKILGRTKVIDPFAGSGTVLLESEFEGVESYGIEAHPYIYRIAKAKLNWNFPADKFKTEALSLLHKAKKKSITKKEFPKLIASCYPLEIIQKLEALKQVWLETEQQEEIKNFNWFIITSILRTSSPVGTAQWQYIQPNKTKARVIDPFVAFEAKVNEMYLDMKRTQMRFKNIVVSKILNEDARDIQSIPNGWGDLVITSPPYANNYDYADATRLEMTFWGDITGWADLQDNVRKHLVRACTQHVSKLGDEIEAILSNPRLKPIQNELLEVYNTLKIERLKHGGKKNYHFMIAAYFTDLADVFHSLRKVTSENALMCFVIGDSAPYGIYVPVDKWLGELAVSAGFSSYSFEKLRDRNTKWKNRKHTVPLHEGRLWINS
ncbi:MAG TPA: DNA modification methylase [Bacteroidia bacterium]|jgi:DNA modification methylase|nr:DNA modification methylase [Bacteroidia bacterium]